MSATPRFAIRILFLLLGLTASASAQTLSFVTGTAYPVAGRPVFADFNGDHINDVAVVRNGLNTVSVLLNAGNGQFKAPRDFAVGTNPESAAVADVNLDGINDIVVANFGGVDADVDGSVSVLIGNGDGTFRPARTFAVGPNPQSVSLADFNLDGVPDLAVATYSSSNVAVLLGRGDGTFAAPQAFNLGAGTQHPISIAVTDVNRDGVSDLAIAVFGDRLSGDTYWFGNISVLIGNGDGTFQAARIFETGWEPASIVAADFDNDGMVDLATANFLANPGSVSILLGNGDGTFHAHQDIVAAAVSQSYPMSLAAADLDADGAIDLVVVLSGETVRANAEVAAVLRGNGDGTFRQPIDYANDGEGTSPTAIAIADVTGDGVVDLAVGGTRLSILTGNGDGTFRGIRTFGPGGAVVAVADMNHDGRVDVVVADDRQAVGQEMRRVSVLLGNGDGTFQEALTAHVASRQQIVSIAVGDFNGDGVVDVAAASGYQPGSVSILLGNRDGTLQLAQAFAIGNGGSYLAAGDVNNDGAPDLLAASAADNTISVFPGNGDGTFAAAQSFDSGGASPQSMALSDLDGDGNLDLVVGNRGVIDCSASTCSFVNSSIAVMFGNGDGTFRAGAAMESGTGPMSIVLGDFNGDGRADLAVLEAAGAGAVAVLLGNGDGTFHGAYRSPAMVYFSNEASVADVNGDGVLDFIASTAGVAVWLGNGDGTLQAPRRFGPDYWFGLAVADLNGDGKPDIVTETAAVLMNDTVPPPPPPVLYRLTVNKQGNGAGIVTSSSTSGDSIDCGNACTGQYVDGTAVMLTATESAGSTFAGWTGCDSVSGATCTVTMHADTQVTAAFARQRFILSVRKTGIGNGTVTSTSNPPSATQINCGATCSAPYDWSTVVTLSAKPALGNLFMGWSGCDSLSGNTCVVTMSGAKSVTASFVGVPVVTGLR
jgi:hypothetical protein